VARASWRTRSRGGEAAPVEMRFVDMFMAALGALIFMAMVLSFLLSFMKPSLPQPIVPAERTQPVAPPPLSIATASLPPGREGRPYQFAFAYRGGLAPITWSIAAGRQELPKPMELDAGTGILSGTPPGAATVRFVLQATDQLGTQARHPYEMTIEPAPTDVKGTVTRAWPIILIIVLFLLWLASRSIAGFAYERLQVLVEAYQEGETQVEFSDSKDEVHVVRLPQGIEQYQTTLLRARGIARFFLLALTGAIGWLAWSSFAS